MTAILVRCSKYRTRAFTLLEALMVLSLMSFLTLFLSGSMVHTVEKIEENLFFISFEHLYRDSQKLSLAHQERLTLIVSDNQVSNGYRVLVLPDSVRAMSDYRIDFTAKGGNSSLRKLEFQTSNQQVSYQLYIGSGKYKKTSQRLHSP